MKKIILPIFFMGLAISGIDSANILALLPTFSPSHLIIEMAVVRAIAEHNHNVTVVTVLPLKPEWLTANMNYIKLDKGQVDMKQAVSDSKLKGLDKIKGALKTLRSMAYTLGEIFEDPKFRELLDNPDNKFDLLLYGYIFVDFYLGVAEHFDCPAALIWPNIPLTKVLSLIGNPQELSYTIVTIVNTMYDGSGFEFRLKNIFAYVVEKLMFEWQTLLQKEIYG